MNILFCGDENVCQGISLAVLSLCRHTKDRLDIYILTANIAEHKAIPGKYADRLTEALRDKGRCDTVKVIDITEIFDTYTPIANMSTRFTPMCMLRLFADMVDEIPDRILYLDTDVMCRGDFSELYDMPLDGIEIAGAPDRYGKWFFGNILRHNYLNSGVLMMNMELIRSSGLFERCRIRCRDEKMFMPDQTSLNKLAVKRKISSRYNCQGRIRRRTVFKHFTTFFRFIPIFKAITIKPWDTDRLHNELHIYEFDDIIDEYQRSVLV